MIETHEPIGWQGRSYFGGDLGFNEEGSFTLHLFTTPEDGGMRGTYFTALPISPTAYRIDRPTKTAIEDAGTAVIVYCDWGRSYRIEAPRGVLEGLLAEAVTAAVPTKEYA